MSAGMRMRFATSLIGFAAFAVLHLAGPALALDANERSFERGRVGAIVGGKTKPADLAAIYGEGNVKKVQIHAPGGGEESPGALIHPDTPDALEVTFSDDGARILSVSINGKNWVSKAGLRKGTSLAELERINGGPVELAGFGWDYGGQVFASGAALKGMDIFVSPTRGSAQELDAATGDRKFSSRDAVIARLAPEVVVIEVRIDQDP
jgi:hypothetical protein